VSAAADRSLRVVVAEDSFLLRAGVVRVLEDTGFVVVGEARDAEELLDQVREHRPDVVVTDIRMPPSQTDEGVRAAAVIRSELPQTGVVVLSQYVKESYAIQLLQDSAAGVGYLLKDRVMEPRGFAEAVRQVARGGSALDPEVVAQMLERRRRGGPLDELSARELDVLAGMAEGRSKRASPRAPSSRPLRTICERGGRSGTDDRNPVRCRREAAGGTDARARPMRARRICLTTRPLAALKPGVADVAPLVPLVLAMSGRNRASNSTASHMLEAITCACAKARPFMTRGAATATAVRSRVLAVGLRHLDHLGRVNANPAGLPPAVVALLRDLRAHRRRFSLAVLPHVPSCPRGRDHWAPGPARASPGPPGCSPTPAEPPTRGLRPARLRGRTRPAT
jgi:DNA-binding NarL/FixJ family response regulator